MLTGLGRSPAEEETARAAVEVVDQRAASGQVKGDDLCPGVDIAYIAVELFTGGVASKWDVFFGISAGNNSQYEWNSYVSR